MSIKSQRRSDRILYYGYYIITKTIYIYMCVYQVYTYTPARKK